ncbi:sphingomyelin phosphodiesterase-like [Culicoides brevitarsis]|uniref:sphingomyelin phosphodiesterase-like n=1 Tax=Culicoides brevitarsis TaxID=469753 RepID=UPI00307B865C
MFTSIVLIAICLLNNGLAADRNYRYRQFDDEIENLREEFYQEHLKFMENGVHSARLLELYDELKPPSDFMRMNLEDIPQPKIDLACYGCRIAAPTLFNYRRVLHMSDEYIERAAIDICVNARITSKAACEGLIRINLESLLFVIDNQPKLTASTFCAFAFHGSCGRITEPEFLYHITVDPNYPVWNESQVSVKKEPETFKIVHITDVHYDPRYVVGNNAKCDDPTCCRQSHGKPQNAADGAGRWGSYDCDVPWESVEDLVQHIKTEHSDAEIIYYTGDTVDHGIWETSFDFNVDVLRKFDDYMASEFKGKQVFPILGNHEAHPVDIFSPEEITKESLSMNYLYEYIAKAWRQFLPQSTELTLKRGGYYTTLVRPGFRVIGLNNNVCYNVNWWVMYHPKEHTVQLNWLHDVLLAAEKAGEKVHILLHQPPGGTSCYYVWAREYQKLIDRFYHIITGQFNGHTHREEFNVFYKSDDISKAINVAWNGGSHVTYTNVNPNYRVYHVDKETLQIVEAVTYFYNLTDANQANSVPHWQKMYSFKEEYGVEDLSPRSVDALVTRFAKEKDLLMKYWEYRYKLAEPALENGCNKNCLKENLCTIVTNQVFDDRKCNELKKLFNKHN